MIGLNLQIIYLPLFQNKISLILKSKYIYYNILGRCLTTITAAIVIKMSTLKAL